MLPGYMWYYSKNGEQMGPVSQEELFAKTRGGEILPSDLIWREGMADWMPLSRVPEFAGQTLPAAISPVASSPSLPAQETGGSVPLPQPPAYHGNYTAPRIPTYMWQSVAALLLSAVMMMVICLPIGMPFAIVALVYASKVEGLRLQGRLMEAESASKSAKVWMIISYALSGLIIIGLIVVLVIALSSGGFAPVP